MGIKQGRTTAAGTAFRSRIVGGVLLQKKPLQNPTQDGNFYGINNFNLEEVALGRKHQDKSKH